MASPNETSAPTADPNSKIGFFDLPRELRDEIYDLALEHDRTITQDSGTMHLHVRAPEVGVLLVSRQFASEYYERSPSKGTICLSVTGSSPTKHLQSAGGFTYAAQASKVKVTLTLDPFDHGLYSYIDPLAAWLFELVKDIACIKTVHVQLCFNIRANLTVFDWFTRTTHRAVPDVARHFEILQKKMFSKDPIVLLNRLDLMVVLPTLASDDANSTGSQLGNVGSWTRAGYKADVGLDEIRRKFSNF
ncbi:hypothetical protein Q7P35_003225 [Cladosporium inversicolor]